MSHPPALFVGCSGISLPGLAALDFLYSFLSDIL